MTTTSPSASRLIDRYFLSNVVRTGGMATVTRALDSQTGEVVAVKRMKVHPNIRRQTESLQREVEALQELQHPNIVKYLDFGKDENGAPFLVMEWLEESLHDRISKIGPLSWRQFADRFGLPLMRAVEFAQQRKRVHRDIKPRNILLSADGTPKLADYGISKLLIDRDPWMPMSGETFRHDRTPGFSPPEPYDDRFVYSRDCYSIAAVATFCLTASPIQTDADLLTATQEAPFPKPIRTIIESCLSPKIEERPPLATVLLAKIERAEAQLQDGAKSRLACSLDLTVKVIDIIERLLDLSGRKAVEQFVAEELSEITAFVPRHSENGDELLSIIGSTWRFGVKIAGRQNERFEVFEAFEIGAARASSMRESGYKPNVLFTFAPPPIVATAGENIRAIFDQVGQIQRLQEAARAQEERGRVFKVWRSFLRDRTDIEARRENAITYIDRRLAGNVAHLTTTIAPSSDVVGQERLVRLSRGYVSGVIRSVILDQVTLEIQSGDATRLPAKGDLLLNTIAAQRALENQYFALDSVVYDRAVSARLKEIVIDPTQTKTPLENEDVSPKDPTLDAEKRAVLGKALGDFELLAIEGPPGTGKTALIAEIITLWLEARPSNRILLASQTHIALDNVLDRIAELGAAPDVVRIGRSDDPRIADSAKPFLLEHKVEQWITRVRSAAEQDMTRWADENGVDTDAVKLGMHVELLIRVLHQKQSVGGLINAHIADRDNAHSALQAQSPMDSQQLEAEALTIDDELRDLRETEKRLHSAEQEIRIRLKGLGEYGASLAESDDALELTEWQSVFLTDDSQIRECKERLALLDDWLLRVGRSSDFNAAMLSSAQVIAGTCVGVAGVRGMQAVEYDLCIIDEASKATATETLIPLSRAKKWIIVGDPRQLPPFFEEFGSELTANYDESEIRQTLLDRFVKNDGGLPTSCHIRLTRQHRMIEPIGELVSYCFYDDSLVSPVKTHGLELRPSFPGAVVWYTTANSSSRGERPVGSSFENPREVEVIRSLLGRLEFVAAGRSKRISIAVITGYTAQVIRLQGMITRNSSDWPGLDIVCNTVDAFQGKQADVCLYSIVRSNGERRLGFLRERPRLNVALSRGKSGLIIVGDHLFCRYARGENPFQRVIQRIEARPKAYFLEDA